MMIKQSAKLSALLLIGLMTGCAYFNTFYNAKKHFSKANDLTQKRIKAKIGSNELVNYDKAIEKSIKLLNQYPDSRYVDDAYLLLGKSYYYKNNFRRAITELKNLKQLFPESKLNLEGDLFRARAQLELKEYVSADSTLRQLMASTKSKDIQARSNLILGDVLTKGGRHAEAIEFYIQAVETGLGREKSNALYKIAAAYDTLNINDKAAEYFKKVEKSEPSWEMLFESKFRYAVSLRKLDNIESSIKFFDKLLASEKNKARFAEIKLEISKCLEKKDDMKAAISTYQDIIQNHSKTVESAEAYYRMGDLYVKKFHDFERAVACYNQVVVENRQFIKVDSSQIKKNSIQKKMALEDVIDMADRGEEGSVDIQNIQAASDSLARLMTAEMDSLKQIQDKNNVSGGGFNNNSSNMGMNNRQQQNQVNRRNTTSRNSRPGGANLIYHSREIDKNLFLLAEIYLFRFAAPDSALSLYHRIITEFSDSPYHIRALYNSGYISKNILNDAEAGKAYFTTLIDQYPKSEYAAKARIELGLEEQDSEEDQINKRFLKAEQLLQKENDPQNAFKELNDLYSEFPDKKLAPKTLYLMAYIQDSYLDNNELARSLYDSVATVYPETEYGKISRKKINAKLAIVKNDSVKTEVKDVRPGIASPSAEKLNMPSLEADLAARNPIGGVESILEYLNFPKSIPLQDIPPNLAVRVHVDSRGRVLDVKLIDPIGKKQIRQVVIKALKNLRFPPSKQKNAQPDWINLKVPLVIKREF